MPGADKSLFTMSRAGASMVFSATPTDMRSKTTACGRCASGTTTQLDPVIGCTSPPVSAMRRTACSASLHLRTRALRSPTATIDSSEPAAGALGKSEAFFRDTPQDLAKHVLAALLHRRTRSCTECGVIRPVITALLGGMHHSNRCLPP